jgi:hypothetical protein
MLCIAKRTNQHGAEAIPKKHSFLEIVEMEMNCRAEAIPRKLSFMENIVEIEMNRSEVIPRKHSFLEIVEMEMNCIAKALPRKHSFMEIVAIEMPVQVVLCPITCHARIFKRASQRGLL